MVDIKERIQDIDQESVAQNIGRPARFVGRGIMFFIKLVFLLAGVGLVVLAGIFGWNVYKSGTGSYLGKHGIFEIEKTGAIEQAGIGVKDVWNTIWHPEQSSLVRKNSWESDIEENKDNLNLGVKITSFQSARDAYESSVSDKKVRIDTYGRIEANSLKEKTILNIACELEDYNGPVLVTPSSAMFEVYRDKLSYSIPRCSFKDGIENNDRVTIPKRAKLIVDYDFITRATSRFYYMDKITYDNLFENGRDPFTEYNVNDPFLKSDRTIKSEATYGPINLGIGNTATQPFIADDQTEYFFNIGLKREVSEGNLKKLNHLKLIMPREIEIIKENCDDFEYYGQEDNFNIYMLKQEKLAEANKDCSESALKNTALTRDDCIKNYKDELVYLCDFKIKESSQGVLSYALVRAEADYNYEVQRSVLIDILSKT